MKIVVEKLSLQNWKLTKKRDRTRHMNLETRELRKINGITIGFGTIKGSESNNEIKSLCWMKCIPEHMSVPESTWYR